MFKAAVTIGKNKDNNLALSAKEWAKELGLPFLERKSGTLAELLTDYQLEAVLVVTQNGPEAWTKEGRFFFHPGMSLLRLKNILAGQGDRLVNALNLQAGMSVLDCTLGLGADASLASYVVGKKGKVVALEASPLIALIVREGLKSYQAAEESLNQAMRRVKVINAQAKSYLSSLPTDSFDVVYFDPMFDYSVNKSSNMQPLRPLAYYSPLDQETLLEARRVAKSRVVVKVVENSQLLTKIDFELTPDGKYSKVKYAVLQGGT